MEGVKDHIVSSLQNKASPFLMWKALIDLFQSRSNQRKLALKDKLRKIKMEKGNSIPKYLMKFVHCKDELGSVGVTIYEEKLVILAPLGFRRVGITTRTLSMDGRNCKDGSDFGQILCRRR